MPQRFRKVLVSKLAELVDEIGPVRALALDYRKLENFLGREVLSDIAVDTDVREVQINDMLAVGQDIRNVIASASTESVDTQMREIKHVPLLLDYTIQPRLFTETDDNETSVVDTLAIVIRHTSAVFISVVLNVILSREPCVYVHA